MKDIKRLFLSHELSSKLKQLGYNETTLYYWFPNMDDTFSLLHRDHYVGRNTTPLHTLVEDGFFGNTIPAPTYQEAIDWFREKMRVRIDIQSKTSGKTGYSLWMWDSETVCWIHVYYREQITTDDVVDELGKVTKKGKFVDEAIVEGYSFLSVMDYYDACERAIVESVSIAKLLLEGKTVLV